MKYSGTNDCPNDRWMDVGLRKVTSAQISHGRRRRPPTTVGVRKLDWLPFRVVSKYLQCLHYLITCHQWRREGACRLGQMSVLPPPPIRSVIIMQVFFRISDIVCEPTPLLFFRLISSFPPLSPSTLPFPTLTTSFP